MAGLDKHRIVLIHSTVDTGSGETNVHGTGYLLSNSLILTAAHVVTQDGLVSVRARVDHPDRPPGNPWVNIEKNAVWRHADLDIALLRLTEPLPVDIPLPAMGPLNSSQKQIPWVSLAFPRAATEATDSALKFKTAGLGGILYVDGGGGQGEKTLELGVEFEAEAWNGISGAPVFVGDDLVGVIKSSLVSFSNKRIYATPVNVLLSAPGFLVGITPPWIEIPADSTWVLILNSEQANTKLHDTVMKAIGRQAERIKAISGKPLHQQAVIVSVNDALSEPGRFLQFVRAICEAPVMVFDVTEFEPAVMLFLGIRAVVRRGITLTTTSRSTARSDLKKLPFNLQETKLIDLSIKEYDIEHPRHPLRWIGDAVVGGLLQLKTRLDYLDLPAYDAVRCPPPDAIGDPEQEQGSLMLCSFDGRYISGYWRYVSNEIATLTNPHVERMLDIRSPRLVGLALYESIRWTTRCIIDWSLWSPNVFFEFGVRLACSDIGPICLIESAEVDPQGPALKQRGQLLTLFDPTRYQLDGPTDPFSEAFRRYRLRMENEDLPAANQSLRHNAAYNEIFHCFHWSQEPVSQAPHLDMVREIQSFFGKDPQRQGRSQVLYSTNPEYARALRNSVLEKYIAAWYYLTGRYTLEEIQKDKARRMELIKLGKDAAFWLKNVPGYERILGEMNKTIDELRTRR